jgi:hypothetical protein
MYDDELSPQQEQEMQALLHDLFPTTPPECSHKRLVIGYFHGGCVKIDDMHSWRLNPDNTLLDIRMCPLNAPKLCRFSIPLANVQYFAIEDL